MNSTGFTPPDPTVLFARGAEQFTRFWNRFSESCTGLDPAAANPESMRQMRGAFLDALAAAWDEYLRSPEFTTQLQQMLQHGVQFQQRLSEMLGHARHASQASSRQDVDAIMEGLQRLDRRINDGFERLDERITRVEKTAARAATKSKSKSKGKRKGGKGGKASKS